PSEGSSVDRRSVRDRFRPTSGKFAAAHLLQSRGRGPPILLPVARDHSSGWPASPTRGFSWSRRCAEIWLSSFPYHRECEVDRWRPTAGGSQATRNPDRDETQAWQGWEQSVVPGAP